MTDTTPMPCPFCGGEAAITSTLYGYPASHWVKCGNCGACSTNYSNRGSALTVWNTRANADARLVEAFEALEPFVCGYTQFPESAKIISKAMDGMTPVSVTVTKAQFLRAITACLALKDTDHG